MLKKLQIVICDDEKMAIKFIEESIKAIAASKGIETELQSFLSGTECFRYLEKEAADLLFLDIAIDRSDGICLAKKLVERKSRKNPDIIFVSNKQNRVFETFEVHPFGFVRKDQFMEDMAHVLNRYIRQKSEEEQERTKFELKDASGLVIGNISKVIYIESYKKIQTIYFQNGESVIVHSTMEKLYEQVMEHDFLRIHKGYIVALKHIQKFGRTEVLTDTKKILPVGRTYYKDAVGKYMLFMRKNGIIHLS